jgi:CxxC motif-containing protein (DUF1111 family)
MSLVPGIKQAPTRILQLSALLLLIVCSSALTQGQFSAKDPGARPGASNAGMPFQSLNSDQMAYFSDGQQRFLEVESVTGTITPNSGLGPGFNSNQCASCHAQPAIGGSSPAVNPQIGVANLNGATNVIPSFITLDGPTREARFKFQTDAHGSPTNVPDGGVHDLFTITGRTDATATVGMSGQPQTCKLQQPNFEQALQQNNVIFRIPTPVFGAGLIEDITDQTILANQIAQASAKSAFGIAGQPNRNGNDGTISRFGWKAQNKSLLLFAAEAYNVEMGVTNEIFQSERGYPGNPVPRSCFFNALPEDTTNLLPNGNPSTSIPSDIVAFANFMRFLDQPLPACTGAGCSEPIQNGQKVFTNIGCALCHTPSLTTTSAYVPALSNIQANLFSDLLVHHMGTGLADGVTQGGAGPDQFRSAPLWGLGQRVFFLHDGRTSDLMQAILQHASSGSEANAVINQFQQLREGQKQDLLDFLRSL